MGTTAEETTATLVPPVSVAPAAPIRPGRPWLFNPAIDLLFVANCAWPIVLLAMSFGGLEVHGRVSFWQIYFVTTPHRWMTLLIVFCDRDRFAERPRVLLGIASVVVAVCLGVRLSTGTLTCLLAVDYVWNVWHFAAQHHGIFRIYGRVAQPEREAGVRAEKVLMRLLVLYTAFRTATWAWMPAALSGLQYGDVIILAIPVWLLAREVVAFDRRSFGRFAYLVSFCLLYTGLLICVNQNRPALVLMFTTAGALFHAVEYLAVVSWSVRARHSGPGRTGTLFARLLPQWMLTLALFAGVLGAGGWMMQNRLLETWLLLNVIVAFLHYSYDGLIWKSPRSRTSTST